MEANSDGQTRPGTIVTVEIALDEPNPKEAMRYANEICDHMGSLWRYNKIVEVRTMDSRPVTLLVEDGYAVEVV